MTEQNANRTPPELPGAPFLAWPDGRLSMDGADLQALARQYGTPLFVYSSAAILAALGSYHRGLAGRDALVCYAVKANSSLAILRLLAQAGCGFDIVSGGELQRVLAAGGDPQRVVFSGIGKTRAEIRLALDAGIRCFNVESLPELEAIDAVARQCGQTAPVSIRVNPNVDAGTHPYISTGLTDNKFGIAHDRVLEAYRRAQALPGLRVVGMDCHIGSQITSIAPYLEAMDKLLDLVQAVEAQGVRLQHLDFGGGLGIRYQDETPPTPAALWQALLGRLDQRGYGDRSLVVEPGRSLVGNAGICITEVLYLKPGSSKNFCIVDAAMNDLPRPALYQSWHDIVPLHLNGSAPEQPYDVVGPVCESGDWLGRQRTLAVQSGDLLAVLSAGAYCMSMASNYNTRPRAAEVLLDDSGHARLIRRRETAADLWALETP